MSPLPSFLPTGEAKIGDETVPIRSLSRADVDTMNAITDATAKEVFVLARGLQVTEEEATKFREEAAPFAVLDVMGEILILTGLQTKENWTKRMDGALAAVEPEKPTEDPQ